MTQLINKKIILFLVVFIAILPVIALRDYTPSNELRYLSIADEALQNNTFFAFTNHGEPYADKPPLYFWGIMLGKWATGKHFMWLISLLSVIPAFCIVAIMDKWIKKEFSVETRFIAFVALLTSGLFIGSSLTLRMDILMCLFIILALRSFWMMYSDTDIKRQQWIFPVFLFLAVFTKGPLGLLIPLASSVVFLAYSRRLKTIGRYWGWRTWVILLCLCGLWFVGVYMDGGKEYLDNLLFHQTVDRAVNSFHHKRPFYYYFIHIWYCIAPWAFLIVGILIAKINPRNKRSELHSFFLIVGLTTFILLSCISAKLQIYMLPAIPFLVYAAVMYLPGVGNNGILRITMSIPAALFALALPGMLIVNALKPSEELNNTWLIIASSILTATGIITLIFLFKKEPIKRLALISAAMGGGLLLAVFTGGWSLTQLNASIGYGTICNAGLRLAEEEGINNFKTWKISRPENMDVYLKKEIDELPQEYLPEHENIPYILFTKTDELNNFEGLKYVTAGPYSAVVIR